MARLYYHVSHTLHPPTTVLETGQWGRATRQFHKDGRLFNNASDAFIVAWEIALETARRAYAPEKPSRLVCLFLCEELEGARGFRNAFRQRVAIYIARPVTETPSLHRGSFELLVGGDEPFVDLFPARAIAYWRNEPSGIIEVLCGSAVVLTERVE
jgi:hypothetical protein